MAEAAEMFSYPGRDLEAMSFAENYHNWILDIVEPHLGEKVIEVGAGDGSVTELLAQRRVKEIFAIEPSSEMYKSLNRLNASPKVTTRKEFFGNVHKELPDDVSSIIYINVMEHIEHDLNEMKLAYDKLPIGGKLVIFVPALPFLYSYFDEQIGHFRRYTLSEVKNKTQEAGFTTLKARYFDTFGILPWFILLKILKRPFNQRKVKTYDKVFVPIMRATEKILPTLIGKNVLWIGEKKS